jgi:ABC-type nitrate/sulfonate/bicarbonate transport system ATPase subunit
MLALKEINFAYKMGTKQYDVIKNLNLTIKDEEFFCIIGPSGCGKSTLLKMIAGFEAPSSGSICVNGKEINCSISHERAMVFQEDAVFPWLSVHDNIEYGLKVRHINPEIRREKVAYFLKLVGLSGFENAYPKELSGGMKKRVDLARVLVNDPMILLMDEPFGALDAMTKEKLQEQLTQVWETSKKTIVFITHDIEEALFLGDRVAIMQPLRNGGSFNVYEIPFQRPRSLYVKEETEFQKMRRSLVEEFKLYEK